MGWECHDVWSVGEDLEGISSSLFQGIVIHAFAWRRSEVNHGNPASHRVVNAPTIRTMLAVECMSGSHPARKLG